MRRGKNKKKIVLFILFLFLACAAPERAQAKESEFQNTQEEELSLEDLNYSALDEILGEATNESSFTMEKFSSLLLSGNWKEALGGLWEGLLELLFSELSRGKNSIAKILLLSAVSAFFVNITSSFQNHQVSETGFYLSYMLMAVFLFSGASAAMDIIRTALEYLFSFMAALMPVFFVAVASAGGSVTAMGFYQLTFFLLTIIEWAFLYLFLPALKLYVVLVLLNSLTKEEMLSGFTKLLETAFSWGLKTVTGIVLGLNVVQGMTLPFADSLKNSGLRKAVSMIPGLGNGADAVAQAVIGSGNLIKNGIGMAAVVAIAVLCLFPLCKLFLLHFLYQAAGAFVQPISDKRLLSGIEGTAKAMGLMGRLLLSAMLLFVLTIAMICAFTNTTYFAG